jgi:hypothetical protein
MRERKKGVLIVSGDPLIIQVLRARCQLLGFNKIIICPHKDASETFSNESPDYLVIAEYDEELKNGAEGVRTWNEFLDRGLFGDQIVVLVGNGKCEKSIFAGLPLNFKRFDRLLVGSYYQTSQQAI